MLNFVNLYLIVKQPTTYPPVLHKGNPLICCVQESLPVEFLFSDTAAISRPWNAIPLTSLGVCKSFVTGEEGSLITCVSHKRVKK